MIVVTRDPRRVVERTLAGLRGELAGLDAEVIVVDDGTVPALRRPDLERLLGTSRLCLLRREPRAGHHAGSARNAGIDRARGTVLVFLDGDCIPAPGFLRAHLARFAVTGRATVSIGHRRFVDADGLDPADLAADPSRALALPSVRSASNYGRAADRRMPELRTLAEHPYPYNVCHGCNLAVDRASVQAVGAFDEAFDGWWGYEDIDFGRRLHDAGSRLVYTPGAAVLHQERRDHRALGRGADRRRNFELLADRAPGYRAWRARNEGDFYTATVR